MDQEATDELIGTELHGLEPLIAPGAIIGPLKGDGMVVIIDDAAI